MHFPVALLPVSVVWDAVGLWLGTAQWWTMSFWTLALGLGASLPALLTGFVEFAKLPSESPAARTATWHLMLTGGAVTLFLTSLLIRGGPEMLEGERLIGAIGCSIVGLGLLAVGGHLGGTLVYQHRVGPEVPNQSESQS